jgi:hypothetical protein
MVLLMTEIYFSLTALLAFAVRNRLKNREGVWWGILKYEYLCETSETFIYAAMIRLMLRRIARA